MYTPASPQTYKDEQIVLNSGRLLFNAKSDAVLLFASKAIGLSSAGTINLDSDRECIINSSNIYLGLNASEPLMLGNTTIQKLNLVIRNIQKLCGILQNLTGKPAGVPDIPVNFTASDVYQSLDTLLAETKNLKTLVSTKNYTR